MVQRRQGAKKGRAAGRFYISQHRWASVYLREEDREQQVGCVIESAKTEQS